MDELPGYCYYCVGIHRAGHPGAPGQSKISSQSVKKEVKIGQHFKVWIKLSPGVRAWLSRSTAPHPSPGSQSGDECINNISSRLLSCSDRNHRPCWNGTPLLQQFKQVYLSKRKLFWWLIKCQPIVVCDRGGANLALVLLLATLNWDIPGPFMEMRHHQIMSWLLNSHPSLSL